MLNIFDYNNKKLNSLCVTRFLFKVDKIQTQGTNDPWDTTLFSYFGRKSNNVPMLLKICSGEPGCSSQRWIPKGTRAKFSNRHFELVREIFHQGSAKELIYSNNTACSQSTLKFKTCNNEFYFLKKLYF